MSENKKFRVLVVDDEQTIRDEFRDVLAPAVANPAMDDLESRLFGADTAPLEQLDYDVVFCKQGDEAVEVVRQANAQNNPFAVVFQDMRMPPGPDGLWTSQEIRKLDENINIVIVTAFSDINPVEISQKVRPPEKLLYVQKPFYPQEIRQFAAALTSKWSLERQLVERNKQLAKVIQTVIATNRKLADANAFKAEFTATIADEFRNPLQLCKLVADNAVSGAYGPIDPKLQDLLAQANTGIAGVARMITQLVDFSELDSNKVSLSRANCVLQDLVRDVCRPSEKSALKKDISVKTFLSEAPLEISVDKFRFKQLLGHLLNNAIEHTAPGTAVTVRTVDLNDSVEIAVEDNGRGIEANDIERIFSQFVKINKQPGSSHGTGLGLHITKALVELHGGTICVASTPGKGATFRVTLPKVPVPALFAPEINNEQLASLIH